MYYGKRVWTVVALAVLVAASGFAGAADWSQQLKLLPDDGNSIDYFGNSVAIDGNVAVVGAYYSAQPGASVAGAAYVFQFGVAGWEQVAKLTASDPTGNKNFGSSVAISGDAILIGASGDNIYGGSSGSAYVFDKPGSGWANMTETAKLVPTSGAAADSFGESVSLSGNTAVIGARFDDAGGNDAGAAYVFQKSGGWSQTEKLTAEAHEDDNAWFGSSVAIDDGKILVGAMQEDAMHAGVAATNSGAAYIFEDHGLGAGWEQDHRLIADGTNFQYHSDLFGNSVALDGDLAVVGARGAEKGLGQNGAGAAYAFVFDSGSDTWVQTATDGWLEADDGEAGDRFGTSVAVSDGMIMIGAPGSESDPNDPLPQAGAAYVFYNDGSTWVQDAKITAKDGVADDRGEGDQYGESVAISDVTGIIGALYNNDLGYRSGSAYVVGVDPYFDPPDPQDVPEPSSLALVVLGLLSLFGLRRNRKA